MTVNASSVWKKVHDSKCFKCMYKILYHVVEAGSAWYKILQCVILERSFTILFHKHKTKPLELVDELVQGSIVRGHILMS